MIELAEIPTVRGVKQANDDLDQARRIVAETELDLYAGDDNLIYPFLELGGIGGVCVHTHVFGPEVKDMVRRYREGDIEGARRIEDGMGPAYDILKAAVGPIGIKAALNLLGFEVGGHRLPLVDPTDGELEQVRTASSAPGSSRPWPASAPTGRANLRRRLTPLAPRCLPGLCLALSPPAP